MRVSGNLLATYGSLKRRGLSRREFRLQREIIHVGYGRARGLLFWLCDYPAALEGRGELSVELFEVRSDRGWQLLDRYENGDTDHNQVLFARKTVRLVSPEVYAWIYFFEPRHACAQHFRPNLFRAS